MLSTPKLKALFVTAIFFAAISIHGQEPPKSTPGAHKSSLPISIFIYDRARSENWQWFEAPPYTNSYGFLGNLLRLGVAQKAGKIDWQLEVSQPSVLFAPSDAISPVTAQGQLGLGASYYAANSNENAAAAFLKQGFIRYHFDERSNLRLGRFEFFDGQEIQPKNQNLAWLQANRISQRLIGNFGFSTAQRSFDGFDGHIGKGAWDLTVMAARADQGVFNMNGNPELNVDLQYLAFTRTNFNDHLLWRGFALGYHDGRTGITKTDNRPLAVRKSDHENIRVGTYGGDLIANIPARGGQFDLLAWGVLQNGRWGSLDQHSTAGALEGGFQFLRVASAPWLRGGYFYGSGDSNAGDDRHETFFQVLPTPWIYAHFPFYNLMNNKDGFVQAVDRPTKRIELRADLHWLRLASDQDLWYQGGGAFDGKVFGYVGRSSGGHASLATVVEGYASWQATTSLTANFCYGYGNGKSTIAAIYPTGRNGQFGYAELVYRWGEAQRPAH